MSERALTLVAKTIQSLANFCEFGVKEAFLIPLNPFLEEKMGMWLGGGKGQEKKLRKGEVQKYKPYGDNVIDFFFQEI